MKGQARTTEDRGQTTEDRGQKTEGRGQRRPPSSVIRLPRSVLRPPSSGSASAGLTVALPGEFYLKARRWWWRVQLPGEDKARARPLKVHGARTAAADRQTAEKIAFEMWEHAVGETAAHQIRMESNEKIERLKAQFLDKVRYFTEIVETANAKMEAEARARTEAEAKLRQWAERKTEDRGQKTEDSAVLREPSSVLRDPSSGPPAPVGSVPARASEEVSSLKCRVSSEESQVSSLPTSHFTRQTSDLPPSASEETAAGATTNEPPVETSVCECCGATGIARPHLTRLDSGQSLCPRCLTAFRADSARIET